MFETELAFFVEHQDELVERYPGKVLVLRGAEVVGAYLSPLDAYQEALTEWKLGTFMLQPCEPGPGAYTVTIAPAADTPQEEGL